jgi:hypothetical protein
MSDSRERFEEWREANAKYIEPADWFQWMDAAWQDAEAQAVRRCAEIAHHNWEIEAKIRKEFPEAFK